MQPSASHNIYPDLNKLDWSKVVKNLSADFSNAQQKAAEVKTRIQSERRCTETTKRGEACKGWAVYGDTKCISHGGIKTIPTTCKCSAYDFPHRLNSGNCNFPAEPKRQTVSYQRKSKKRMRKLRIKKWLKEMGL